MDWGARRLRTFDLDVVPGYAAYVRHASAQLFPKRDQGVFFSFGRPPSTPSLTGSSSYNSIVPQWKALFKLAQLRGSSPPPFTTLRCPSLRVLNSSFFSVNLRVAFDIIGWFLQFGFVLQRL